MSKRVLLLLVAAVLVTAVMVASRGQSAPINEPPPPAWQPRPGTSWQWQLQGTIDTDIQADVFDIDLFDAPQQVIDDLHGAGRRVICYFSAGTWESWRPDAGDFPEEVLGNALAHAPGERWL
ncbi:MAG: endo alpha-1,4 polygalactosaminidase, partial [Caldilineae bacterium]